MRKLGTIRGRDAAVGGVVVGLLAFCWHPKIVPPSSSSFFFNGKARGEEGTFGQLGGSLREAVCFEEKGNHPSSLPLPSNQTLPAVQHQVSLNSISASTKLEWGYKDTIPSAQFWSYCQGACRLRSTFLAQEGGRDRGFVIDLFDPSTSSELLIGLKRRMNHSVGPFLMIMEEGQRGKQQRQRVLLSKSRWHGFFHHATEEIIGEIHPEALDLSATAKTQATGEEGSGFTASDSSTTTSNSSTPLISDRSPSITSGSRTFTNSHSSTSTVSNSNTSTGSGSDSTISIFFTSSSMCDHIINRPVFILPLLTWHVGHLLIDLLEPLYYTMMDRYGGVNRDVEIYIEVSRKEEREVLPQRLQEVMGDTPFSLLQLFTSHPVRTVDDLVHEARNITSKKGICFRELHLGLDYSPTYTAHGYDWHRRRARGEVDEEKEEKEMKALKERYQAFRTYVMENLGLLKRDKGEEEGKEKGKIEGLISFLKKEDKEQEKGKEEGGGMRIQEGGERLTLIERRSSRRLLNPDDVLLAAQMALADNIQHPSSHRHQEAATNSTSSCSNNNKREGRRRKRTSPYLASMMKVALEDLPFSEQLELLYNHTSIYITQYGTAAHNSLFLPSGSISVLLMQPGWCDWSWVYGLQAKLLDIHTLIYCPGKDTEAIYHQEGERRIRWATKAWHQGPWYTKDKDYGIDPSYLRALLRHIPAIRQQQEDEEDTSKFPVEIYMKGGEGEGEERESSVTSSSSSSSSNSSSSNDTIPPVRAHVTLDDVIFLQPGHVRFKVVPEIILADATGEVDRVDGGEETEGQYLVCVQVFVLSPEGGGEDPSSSSTLLCKGEEAFNEFSTLDLDLHLDPEAEEPSYVLHAWLMPRTVASAGQGEGAGEGAGEAPPPLVPGSHCFLPLSTQGYYHPQRQAQDGEEGGESRSDRRRKTASYKEQHYRKQYLSPAIVDPQDPTVKVDVIVDDQPQDPSVKVYVIVDDQPRDPTGKIDVIADDQPRTLQFRLSTETTLALDITTTCSQLLGISTYPSASSAYYNCALLASVVYQKAYELQGSLLANLPAPQVSPSPSRPFIFYHLEKSGGSTLRGHLARTALQLNQVFFIACYDEKAQMDYTYKLCHRWNIKDTLPREEDRRGLAVVAGHFQWNVRDELLVMKDQERGEEGKEPSKPACLSIMRDPIERVISFYYERLAPTINNTRLNDLEVSELEFYLQEFYGSAYARFRDEGMSNAACKLFCDGHTHHGYDPLSGLPPPPPVPLNLTLAKERLAQCMVGLQEEWSESKRMIKHWFPWLSTSLQKTDNRRENTGNWQAERKDELRPEIRKLILEYNQCDVALYQYAQRLFSRQKMVLGS